MPSLKPLASLLLHFPDFAVSRIANGRGCLAYLVAVVDLLEVVWDIVGRGEAQREKGCCDKMHCE